MLLLVILLASAVVGCCVQPEPPGDLVKAARERNGEAAIEALRGGADVNQEDAAGRTALIYAGRYCLERVAMELIRAGAPVNHQAKDGRTALIEAAAAGCVPVTALLLENGALKQVVDRTTRDALAYATDGAGVQGPKREDYQEIVALLR